MAIVASSLKLLPLERGEGNGNPLQYSCLENPMDGGAWKAAVHGVAEGWTQLSDSLSLFTFMHWRRKWHATPVFVPGESQGRGSLVGCCLWGRTESDTTEVTAAAAALFVKCLPRYAYGSVPYLLQILLKCHPLSENFPGQFPLTFPALLFSLAPITI